MILLDRMLYKHVIVGLSKVVWIQTTFGPAIHHLSPHITFDLPWFQLRDRSRKLSPEATRGFELFKPQTSSAFWHFYLELKI
jgi:hypothetical protein